MIAILTLFGSVGFVSLLVLFVWEHTAKLHGNRNRPSTYLAYFTQQVEECYAELGRQCAKIGFAFDVLYRNLWPLIETATDLGLHMLALMCSPLAFFNGYYEVISGYAWKLTPFLSSFFWNITMFVGIYLALQWGWPLIRVPQEFWIVWFVLGMAVRLMILDVMQNFCKKPERPRDSDQEEDAENDADDSDTDLDDPDPEPVNKIPETTQLIF